MNGPRPRAVILAGPTASGKTAVAMALARELPLEIVSVDSATVYRGMDIGTAKPDAAERAAVPHHLIDILDPAEAYSAARFAADATRLIAEINARGRLALLVGGTMLYVKALREGLDTLPAADSAVRAALDARAAALGWPALHAELARVDPATAARLAPHDAQRIQRALEVWQTSGRPLSDWQQRRRGSAGRDLPGDTPNNAPNNAPGDTPNNTPNNTPNTVPDSAPDSAGMPLPIVSLEPADRGWLHERIAARFDTMLAAGLLDEVRTLRARSDLHPGLPSMRCVGYRQAWAALDGGDLGPLRDQGVAATRQLAKRQLTWLRAMTDRHTVAADHRMALTQAVDALRRFAGGA